MASNTQSGDIIEDTIRVNADQALMTIAQLQQQGMALNETFKVLGETIMQTAKETGISVDIIQNKFKELLGGQGLFGKFGDTAGFKEVGNEIKNISAAEEQAATSGLKMMTAQQLLNTVMGTLTAMGVFQVIQAISVAFSDAVKYANEYYQSLQNIAVAQNSLALGGINVTNQQLLDMVDQLDKKFGTFAKVDMMQAVSQAALLSSNLHLSVEQIQQLTEMAATLARLHGGLPQDYIDNLLKAASGTNALWANQMGIAATAQDILQKAKDLGLVQQNATKITDDNTKAVAGLAVEWDKLGPQEQKVLQDNNSQIVKAAQNTKQWKDTLTELGTIIMPMWNAIKEEGVAALGAIAAALEFVNKAIINMEANVGSLAVAMRLLFEGQIHSLEQFRAVSEAATQSIKDQLQGLQQTGNVNMANTPVSPFAPTAAQAPAAIAQPEDLGSVQSAYQSYYDSMAKDAQSFNNRMQDMQDQYNLNVQKLVDDTNLRIMNTEQEYNLRRQQEAAAFHQKMKDMQNQYLLDLEGALRKRDAEAVINIIERYKNQVDQAKAQEKLQTSNQAAEEKLRITQMKEEEQLRLKQMAEEFSLQKSQEERNYAQQQADLAKALDEKLQEEAVKLAQKYNLNQGAADKLYGLFKNYYGPDGLMASTQQAGYLAMEQNTANMIAQMQTYIGQYAAVMSAVGSIGGGLYSEGGLAGRGATSVGTIGEGGLGGYGGLSGYGVPGGLIGPPAPTYQPSAAPPTNRKARGGIDLAQSATTVTYGEAGPELAMFLPLNASQAGQIATSGIGDGAGGGSATGHVQIDVTLDPDLQARIVNNTLNAAAITIKKVYGSR